MLKIKLDCDTCFISITSFMVIKKDSLDSNQAESKHAGTFQTCPLRVKLRGQRTQTSGVYSCNDEGGKREGDTDSVPFN